MTQQPTTQAKICRQPNIANVVSELWERTADRLTPSELEWFANAAEPASLYMQNLEEVIEGIGCLVCSDADKKGHAPTGMFQNSWSTSALLFFLAESVSHARELVEVSNAASSRLRNPGMHRPREVVGVAA